MQSVCVVQYDESNKSLDEIARDPASNWMTTLAAPSDDAYIGSDNHLNFFTLQRHPDALTEEERARLDLVGVFHVGDLINAIRPGSLVRLPDETQTGIPGGPAAGAGGEEGGEEGVAEMGPRPQMVYGSLNGAIGVILSLPTSLYHFLKRLERAAAATMPSVGGLSHDVWRSWYSDDDTFELLPTKSSHGYVDGDLIEMLLELDRCVGVRRDGIR